MCRSIKRLRVSDGPAASEDEIREAALQFVRKISGYRVPSQRNRVAFDQAVQDIARVSSVLLDSLAPTAASMRKTPMAMNQTPMSNSPKNRL